MIRTFAVASLLLLPFVALADEPQCQYSEPRDLKLDVAGAKAVVFQVSQHDLVLQAGPGPHALTGRACASRQDLLKDLVVTQSKEGGKLIVRLQRENQGVGSIMSGNQYAYLDLRGTIPDNVLIQMNVGSGDASVTGAHSLSADVGSGDIDLRDIKGLVTAAIGSGDVELDGAGSLNLLQIGSGDFTARNIGGAAKVGNVGSGDVKLHDVAGNADIGTVGSGDIDLQRVKGSVTLAGIGSGDFEARQVGGSVKVERHGSGDVTVRDVGGDLTVGSSGSGDINYSNVRGRVQLPRGK